MGRGGRAAYVALVVAGAALAAAALAAAVLAAIGASPWTTFRVVLTGPLRDLSTMTEIVVRAVPLALVGLGIAVAFRAGILNIGGEGQMLVGIAAGTAVALGLRGLPGVALLPLTLLAGALGGALWAGLAGVLKARFEVNEVLCTVMLNYVAAQLYSLLLRGPLMDPEELVMGSGTPQSTRLPRAAWLDRLVPGTRLHTGLFLALALAAVVWVLLWRTTTGFRLRAVGAGQKAARYAGMSVPRTQVLAMAISGLFAGLAGAVELTGVHRRAIEGISSGYGFTGIVVALFGGLHPAGVVPAAVFFGLLLVGADMTQRSAGVPANVVLVLQGAAILAIVSARALLANPYAAARAAAALRRALAAVGARSTGGARGREASDG